MAFILSGHPLEEYEEKWRKNISAVTADFMLDEETNAVKIKDNQSVVIGGTSSLKRPSNTPSRTKRWHSSRSRICLERWKLLFFPRDYEKYSRYLNEDEKMSLSPDMPMSRKIKTEN